MILRPTHSARIRSIFLSSWFILVAIIGIVPPLLKPGFPPNHEDDTFVLRTMVYAKHFQFSDLVPVWSSSDNFGMGSPLPSLYHRLFYILSGFVYAVTNNSKVAIALSLIIFTAIGVCFVFLTLRSFHCSQQIAIIGASTLPFLNYSVTNWLVRGAMAEYSAMMLIPLVLYVVKKSWDRGSLYAPIGFVFGCLFLAHSVIAYYMALIFGTVLIASCLFQLLPWTFFSIKQVALSVLAFISVTWWSLLPMLYFRQRFDVGRLLPDFLNVQFQFHSAKEYLWDSAWSWSNAPQLFTVQMDTILLLGLLTLLLMRRYSTEHIAIFAILAISVLLQNGRSWRFYNLVPGAEFIQFPWRLSALSSVVLLILVFIGLRHLRTLALLIAVLTILPSGTWQRVNYYSYPDRLETRNSRSLSNYSLSLFGEYLPADGSLLKPDPASSAVFSEWKPKIDEFIQATNSKAGCALARVTTIGESRKVSFSATCDKSSIVMLPIFTTSAHSISTSPNGVSTSCLIDGSYQSLCMVDLPKGSSEVTVHMPTFFSVLSRLLHF
jgi:hypothetical protein